MSLATRCTSCGTIFKVVQDQLKVSEGWVRCGRCNEVFNALDGLFDLERDPPPQRPANAPPRSSAAPEPAGEHAPATPAPPTSPVGEWANEPTQPMGLDNAPARRGPSPVTPPGRPPAPTAALPEELPATHEDDALDSRWLLRPSSDGRSASERRPRKTHSTDFADARFPKDVEFDLDDSDFQIGPDAPAPRPMPTVKSPDKSSKRRDSSKKKPPSKASDKAAAAATPDFVRRANRQAQWRHPAVRATLAGVTLALMALLVGQAAYAFRDELAARHPEWRPVVEQICALTGCEIAPWRHIEDLAVDSVTLVRGSAPAGAPDSPDNAPADAAYKLNVVLHNRASVPIATPHVELNLTDSAGELVSKRVLSPAELGFTAAELAPDSTTTLQARLASAGNRIAGYTVELFYP